jgi:sortase A
MAGRLARILSTALITAGLVVLLDVGITLAWSEPVSTMQGWLAQREAAAELERLEREFRPRAGERFDATTVRALADRFEGRAKAGEAIGRIEIAANDLNIVVVEGTDTETLKRGPGHYPETVFPGQPGTVAFAGHRTTYLAPFRRINEVGAGDEVVLEMPYATFTYRFEEQRIVDPSQTSVVRDVDHDRLVLTACHPLYSAAQRIVVFARLVGIGPPGGADEPRGRPSKPATAPDPPSLGPAWAGAGGVVLVAAAVLTIEAWRDRRRTSRL